MLEQQLTTPSWTEFAWCAFLYKMINAGDVDYQELMEDVAFLNATTQRRKRWQSTWMNITGFS
jgi:hypothetical protein